MSDANSGFMFLRLSKKHYELSSQEIEVSAIKLPLYLIPTLLLLIFWDRFGSGVAAVLSVLQEGRYLPRNFISHHHCNRARWIKTTTFQFQVRIICCMFLILLCLPAPCSAVLPASLLPFFPSSLAAAWQLRTEPKSEFLETVSRWCLK